MDKRNDRKTIFNVFKCFQFEELKISNKESDNALVLFSGRFFESPSKEDLIHLRKLLDNTINNYDFVSDSINDLNCEIQEDLKQTTNDITEKKHTKNGYIYLAKCSHSGFYKIGATTRNPKVRVQELSLYNPTIKLINSFHVKDIKIEMKIHDYFKDKMTRNEWFDLSNLDIKNLELKINKFNNEV